MDDEGDDFEIDQARFVALSRAVDFAAGRDTNPEAVVEAAEAFHEFLTAGRDTEATTPVLVPVQVGDPPIGSGFCRTILRDGKPVRQRWRKGLSDTDPEGWFDIPTSEPVVGAEQA